MDEVIQRRGAGIRSLLTLTVFGLLFLFFSPIYIKAEEPSIQQQIDAAKPGETIELKEGEYEESMIINKPIHLVGTGDVTLIQKDSNPAVTIKSDHVFIENLNIRDTNETSEASTILMNGDNNTLHQIRIHTSSVGIQLDEANDNTLSNIYITGNKNEEIKSRNHGIDLWKSHQNEIVDTRIKHVKDGIYLEKSNTNKINRTIASHSRYGYHLMFTKKTELKENESFENISGLMVMGADGTVVKKNTLKDNQTNIQSLGLLLFDTVHANIEENDIVNNRVGVFVESAIDNTLVFNNVRENYIGIEFKGAERNHIVNNSFTANVVQGQATESSNNNTNKNYWGDHLGLNLTGDETSDITYKVDPFFLNITSEYPPFQLLFQSPGMVFLEQLIHTPVDQQLIDESPLMENPLVASNDSSIHPLTMILFCTFLLMISILIIYLGVRKNEKI